MAIDLNALVPSLVNLGFDLADQIVLAGTYTHTTAGNYDPSLGTISPTVETASVNALLASYKASEIDGVKIKVGDRKAVLKASELTGITSVRLDDTLTVGGEKWQVVDFIKDPTGTVYQMQVRRVM